MSSSDPYGNNNPFGGMFGDIFRLLSSANAGPMNWDVARQVAGLIAGEGQAEGNADPLQRIQLEQLVRLAELHVNQKTELGVSIRNVETINHIEWAMRSLEDYRSLFDSLASGLSGKHSSSPSPEAGASSANPESGLDANELQMQAAMLPVLLGMQAGAAVGYQSRRSLGQYDLPIPRDVHDTLTFVPTNIQTFATEWSLPQDELSLHVAIEEVIRLGVISRPHVHQTLTTLLHEYVSGFEVQGSPDAMGMLSGLSFADPTSADPNPNANPTPALDDPQALLGAVQTPAQVHTLQRLSAITAALVGYVDVITKMVAKQTIASAPAIAEANKRRRVEENDGSRIAERLFGLELGQAQFDRGEAFVNGVLERTGEVGLARLWLSSRELPTPAEIDAPGLWLARIDLDLDPDPTDPEPDPN